MFWRERNNASYVINHGQTRTFLTHVFLITKLRIWASTESFLKLSDFEFSKFLTSFLKVSQQSSCSLPVPS